MNNKINYKILVGILSVIIFLGLFFSHKNRGEKRKYADFNCFYITGQRVLEQKNIYVIRDQETAEFRYTPIFAVIMSGLARLDQYSADTIWYISNFILFIVSLVLLRKLIASKKLKVKKNLLLFTLLASGVLRIVLHNLEGGQTNILMMASMIIGLYLISQKKEFAGGMIFAFSIMIKYTPLIFIPYFLLRNKIRLSLVIISSVMFYLFVPAVFIGFKTNWLYIKNLIPFLFNSTILDPMTIITPKNQSLFSAITRLFTDCISYYHAPRMPFQSLHIGAVWIKTIFISIAGLLYSLILFVMPRNKAPSVNITNIDYALLFICVILFNFNSWLSNYIMLLLPYFIVINYLIDTHFKSKLFLVLLVFSFALNNITMKSVFGTAFAHKIHFYSPLTLSALIAFILLLKVKYGGDFLGTVPCDAGDGG